METLQNKGVTPIQTKRIQNNFENITIIKFTNGISRLKISMFRSMKLARQIA